MTGVFAVDAHSVRGLEFDDGFVPGGSCSASDDAEMEERRRFSVALTRARPTLHPLEDKQKTRAPAFSMGRW